MRFDNTYNAARRIVWLYNAAIEILPDTDCHDDNIPAHDRICKEMVLQQI